MVRLGVWSRRGAAALVFVAAACSAHSRVQQSPSDGDAGRASTGGSSAGRANESGQSGGGATSAAGRGGVTGGASGASGSVGASAGTSSQGGVGGATDGNAGDASGGAPEAGAGGGESVGDGPAWIPTGVFGPAVDDFLDATIEYLAALCRAGLCVGPNDDELLPRCIEAELHNFVPSLEWVACASRAGAEFEHVLAELAAGNRACAATIDSGSCGAALCPPPSVDRSFAGCPEWNTYPTTCPTGTTTFQLCDGRSDCPDGYDERNCDRQAPSYVCVDRMTVDWHAICDGTEDCSDGADEFRCEP